MGDFEDKSLINNDNHRSYQCHPFVTTVPSVLQFPVKKVMWKRKLLSLGVMPIEPLAISWVRDLGSVELEVVQKTLQRKWKENHFVLAYTFESSPKKSQNFLISTLDGSDPNFMWQHTGFPFPDKDDLL